MKYRGNLKLLFARVLGLSLLSLVLLSGVSEAAGPSWGNGFPKLAKKNALLQWAPVAGAAEYKVYRSTEKGKGLKLVSTVKVNRYIDKDLSADTYYYYVSAVTGGKEGDKSEAGVVTLQAEKVFVPIKTPSLAGAHVKDLPDGSATVGLRWEGAAGTDLVGINVYRSKARGKDYVMLGSSSQDMYEDKDVKRGDTYYYVVTAVDSQFKETKYSNEVSVTVPKPVEAAAQSTEKVKAPPTPMKKAKLLFRINNYYENDEKSGKPVKHALEQVRAVAVDEAVGHIYVTCASYGGVLVYNMNGEFQFGFRKDGVSGKDKFRNALGIAVGPNGDVYVSDGNDPVFCIFTFEGKLLREIKVDISDYAKLYPDANPPPTANLSGIAVSPSGRIYVGEIVSNRLMVYDKDARKLFSIKNKPESKIQNFNGISHMTLDKEGDVVFVDAAWSRLQQYDSEGKFKRTISKPGSDAGDLDYPTGLTTSPEGDLLVAAAFTPNIQAFSDDGKFIYALCNEKADGPMAVSNVRGIFMDKQDRLYLAEDYNNRVSVFQVSKERVNITPE